MLDSNSAFFKAATKDSFLVTSHSVVIELYNGTMPDDALFLDETHHSSNRYTMDTLKAALNPDNTMLAGLGFETNIIAEYEGADTIVFPLSDSVREFYVQSAGTATWFMMYIHQGSVTDPSTATGLVAPQILIGTVGDIGSGEDLELPSAEIAVDRDFKCSDVVINLV